MDLQFSFSLFMVFASLLFFVLRFKTPRKLIKMEIFPPQPWKLPLIGHMHHLLGAPPHRSLAKLARKLGPIVSLQLGEISTILISSPSLAKDILKTHDLEFADRSKLLSFEIVAYGNRHIPLAPYGEYWRQMRKICSIKLLSAKKVRSFRAIREREIWNLVESITNERSKTVNLSEKISTLMNMIICKIAVGGQCKDQARLLSINEEILHVTGGFDVSDIFPSISKLVDAITGKRKKMIKTRAKIDEIYDDLISKRQQRSSGEQKDRESEDLLDVLLRLKDDGELDVPLTTDHIKAVILDMFLAGTDTSSETTVWAMSELIKNPRVMGKVQSEIRNAFEGKEKIHESDIQGLEYLKLVIMETLRLHPPLPLLIPRECRETCEIGGYKISVKTKVIINMWKIGNDPDSWTDPESFMPERFSKSPINMMGNNFEYFPFGSGRRICPGMTLGLANVELLLVMLLYHFNWELPNGARFQDLDMSESFGPTPLRQNPLLLVPHPYC